MASRGIDIEARVEEGVAGRCLPAWTRRSSGGGMEVRRERSCLRVPIVVEGGMLSGIAESGTC